MPRHQTLKESIKYWVELVGIVFGIIGVFVIAAQYREMVKATNATLKAVEVGQGQMLAAQQQVAEMRKQRELDERAWVVPIRYSITNGKYRVEYKNTGKTPALNVDADVRSTTNMNDSTSAKWPLNPPGPYAGVLGPNIEASASTERISGSYFFGRIWYNDIFGNLHWIEFCVQCLHSDAGDNFYVFPFGNTTDDSAPDKPH